MRVLFGKFITAEDGASLVEYAVALIVVTIIGGAGVIAIGQNAGTVTGSACDIAQDAVTAVGGTTTDCADDVGGGGSST